MAESKRAIVWPMVNAAEDSILKNDPELMAAVMELLTTDQRREFLTLAMIAGMDHLVATKGEGAFYNRRTRKPRLKIV